MSADSHSNPGTKKVGICSEESNILTVMIKQEHVENKAKNDNGEYNEFLCSAREIEHINCEIPVENLILKPEKEEPSALPIKNEDSSYENTSKYNLLQQALVSYGVKSIKDKNQFGSADLTSHVKKPNPSRKPENIGEYMCGDCGRILKRKSELRCHIASHAQMKQKLFSCDFCDKVFTDKSKLITHDLLHKGIKKYTCDLCNKSFATKSYLPTHFELHSDRSNIIGYKWPGCGFSDFTSHVNKLTHSRRWGKIFKYKCGECGRRLKRKTELRHHMVGHTPSREKFFSCDLCGQLFTAKSSLLRHALIHKGIRKYTCDFCNKSFTNKSYLPTHFEIHSDRNRIIGYDCPVCGFSGKQKCNLSMRMLTHTEIMPYTCHICGSSFKANSDLKEHAKT